jgi:flagellar biosynthesis/type III secretory pathway protein FliH
MSSQQNNKKCNSRLRDNKIRKEIRKKLNEDNINELNVIKDEYFTKVKDIKNEYININEYNEQYNNKFKNLKKLQKEQYNIKFNELYIKQKEVDKEEAFKQATKEANKKATEEATKAYLIVNAFVESCFL